MMEQETYQTLQQALSELNWQTEAESLEQLRAVSEQGLYFVAFIGQYSAGKSYLINNILGRELLPRGIVETTPLLTYIRYGEQEEARLHYQDGAVEILSMDMVDRIVQHPEQTIRDPEQLEHLEVCLPEEMLKNGMVLLDTPGINTLIERHEKLLTASLGLASKVVYVTGGAPSALDIEKMSDIRALGMDVAFVRTHCDEIRASEEDVETVIRSDQETLREKCSISSENCWHVSNLKESGNWYAVISEGFRDHLTDLGEYAHEELKAAERQQAASLAARCIGLLTERAEMLEASLAQDSADFREKKRACEERIKKLQGIVEQKESDYQRRASDLQKNLRETLDAETESQLKQASDRILRSRIQPNDAQGLQTLYEEERRTVVRALRKILDETTDSSLQDLNSRLFEGFEIAEKNLAQLPVLPATNYTELAARQDLISERMLDQLKEAQAERALLEQRLSAMQNDPEYLELPALLASVQEQIKLAKQENDSLPPFEPRMILVEPDKIQPSQVASVIGSILDWAMLLIPSPVSIGTAAKTLLVGKNSANLTKYARLIGKIEKSQKIITKGIKTGATLKDTTYALQNMSKTYATAKRIAQAEQIADRIATGVAHTAGVIKNTKNQGGGPLAFLDYFTFQYWAEKIGKEFDAPPKYVEDEVYRKADAENRRRCREALLAEQAKEYQLRSKMGAFRTEQERLEAERKSRQVSEDRLRREINEREVQCRREFMEQAAKEWRRQCAAAFQQQMRAGIERMADTYLQEIPDRLEAYRQEMLVAWEEQLLEEQQAYARLTEQQPDQIREMLDALKHLLEKLREIEEKGTCASND